MSYEPYGWRRVFHGASQTDRLRVIDRFRCGFTSHLKQNGPFQKTFPQANLLASHEKKLNLTQEKHTFTNQKKCTTTHNKHKKTKVRFSRLLRHPAWKRHKEKIREAYIINSQAPKPKIKSRAHCTRHNLLFSGLNSRRGLT